MSVTICIPTYNQADFVEATVRSAAQQIPTPEAIIVSNDCSTDGTAAILDRLEKEIDCLTVVHQPRNLGMGANPDACLRMATTDYIVKLDSDDLLLPGYVAQLRAALDAHPAAGYAHGQIREIDGAGREVRVRRLNRKGGYEDNDTTLRKAVHGYRVAANIIMFRRTALEAAGYVNREMAFAEDYFLNVSIADAGFGNVYVPVVLAAYRVWADEGNKRQRRKRVELEGLITVFEDRLLPAFQRRNWPTDGIRAQRTKLARRHAQALAWPVFSEAEKDALAATLLRLSPVPAVRRTIAGYRNGYGFIFRMPGQLIDTGKSVAKRLLRR